MTKVRTLLVDDDAAVLTTFRALLEMEGCDVRTASSAAEAKTALSDEPFEFIVTDMRMETPTAGWDVIRAAHDLAHRPVVTLVTAFPVNSSECRDFGVAAVFVKGSDPGRLLRGVRDLIGTIRRKTPVSASPKAAKDRSTG